MNKPTTTLIHGDCLEEMAKLPDNSIDLVLADPPYGTTYCKWDTVIPFAPLWEQLHRITHKTTPVVLTAVQPFTSFLICSNKRHYKYSWTWRKPTPTGFLNAKKQPLRVTEDVVVFYRSQCHYTPQMRQGFKPYARSGKREKLHPHYNRFSDLMRRSCSDGERYPINLLDYKRDRPSTHPTQKPVALLSYLIETYTKPGHTVLDFTMGSGSTGVACHETGRNFIGIELDKGYFDGASKRLADLHED